MTSKRTVFVVAALGVVLLVVAGTRTWVTGDLNDAVLQHAQVTVTGSKAAPACLGAAFVGAAATIAALTTGRIARWISAVLVLLAGLLALVGALWVVQDPSGAVQSRAASATGHTGHVAASAALTIWPWVGVLGAVLLTIGGACCVLGVRRWSGLSSSYDAPTGKREKVVSDWDRLSAGDDPTSDDQG